MGVLIIIDLEMGEVTTVTRLLQMVAVVLFCAYFLFNVYEIYSNKDKWASSFYSAYGNFESWWNKQFKRTLMKEFAFTFPDQKELYPYKSKVTMIVGYAYGFGSLLFLTGETLAALILVVPHFVVSLVTNGPTFAKT